MPRKCANGLGFNDAVKVCDFPQNLPVGTTTTAGTAHLQLVPLRIVGLTATVTTTLNSNPLPLYTVVFTAADGTVLCQAQTGFDGVAACEAPP